MAASAVASREYPAQPGPQLITARLRRTICERIACSRVDPGGLSRAGPGIAVGSGNLSPLVEFSPGDGAGLLVTRAPVPGSARSEIWGQPGRLLSTASRPAGAVACQSCLLHPKI